MSRVQCRPLPWSGAVALTVAAAVAVTAAPERAAAAESSSAPLVAPASGQAPGSGAREAPGTVRLAGKQADGAAATGWLGGTELSRRARFVAFNTPSGGMLPGEAGGGNNRGQVYLTNRRTGEILRVSSSPAGVIGNAGSGGPKLTPNGSTLVYSSAASNLLDELMSDDTSDVYRYDVDRGVNQLVSVGRDGGPGNGGSGGGKVSRTGNKIVFISSATNLVRHDDVGNDVFLWRENAGRIRKISTAFDGGPASSNSNASDISADGDWIAFESYAPDIVEGDRNGVADVFSYDVANRTTELVSVDGEPANSHSWSPTISADGTRIAFESKATNLTHDDGLRGGPVRCFVRDLTTGMTELVARNTQGEPADSGSHSPSISNDGTRVTFDSRATNLAPDDTWNDDVFMRDLTSGTTVLVTRAKNGEPADQGGLGGSMSPDGGWVGFYSGNTNLVRQDLHGTLTGFVARLR